ncbi:ABC transporter permease [Chordicoccus furentiruminis]|uniref:ABC transporter permease n=1 Tax=Chordicoccus furentiruminis TaxID=2709410 RepID=UPI0023A8B14F|nr:ABC transporter permease [Chordicoccus furentiruminis]
MKQKNKKAALTSTKAILIYVIAVFCLIVGLRQPAFFSPATIITTLRASIFWMCFALSEMIVILSGGIDVSFPAIGCAAMYIPMYMINQVNHIDNAAYAFVLAILIGLLFGLLNAVLVSILNIPPLIATLATSSISQGGMITLLGTREFTTLPDSLNAIYNTNILSYTAKGTGFTYLLNVLVLVPVVGCILIGWMLRHTMLGRGLYAIGGDKNAARVAGFNVRGLQFFAYAFSGAFAGLTAMIYNILMHSATTSALMGDEMITIAACVIGGVRITGGHGDVPGTVLGVLLITLVQNNLNMLGIPTSWQRFAVGLVILLGTILTSWQAKRATRAAKRGEA